MRRPIPIFDTNIFRHVQSGKISRDEWRRLQEKRPANGWPLSSITAIELLAGLSDVSDESFPRLKERIELAWNLSNGRVLKDPRLLICEEVLHIPFPPDQLPPEPVALQGHMDGLRRTGSLRNVPVPLDVFKELVEGPKAEWKRVTEEIATKNDPGWRERFRQTGTRLLPEMRAQLEPWSVWEANRPGFVETLLTWLGAKVDQASIAEMDRRLDALLRFTMWVVREFLIGNYNLDRHHSDVFDQFQLQYLAIDGFVVVSNDPDLRVRTSGSPQASRIMTFPEFLQSL